MPEEIRTDGPVPIRLKWKYAMPKSTQKRAGGAAGGNSGNKKRNKVGAEAKKRLAPQTPTTMRVDGLTGRVRLEHGGPGA